MNGIAVLTAVQAQQKSIDEIGELIKDRRFNAYIKGLNGDELLDGFWKNMAIMEANRCRKNRKSKLKSLQV